MTRGFPARGATILIALFFSLNKVACADPIFEEPEPLAFSWIEIPDADAVGRVHALISHGGRLVAGGTRAGVVGGDWRTRVASWDGVGWVPVGHNVGNYVPDRECVGVATEICMDEFASVDQLIEFQGDLVAAGGFFRAGDSVANGVARWDGEAWSPLGSGLPGADSAGPAAVVSLEVHESELFAATATTAFRWANGSWLDLDVSSSLRSGLSYSVEDLVSTDRGLIILVNSEVGFGDTSFQEANLLRWDGVLSTTRWYANGSLHDGAWFGGRLYLAISIEIITGVDPFTYEYEARVLSTDLISTAIRPVADFQLDGGQARVSVLHVAGGSLYMGGSFDQVDSRGCSNVARLTGSGLDALSVELENSIYELPGVTCFATHDGEIYAGSGVFYRVGEPAKRQLWKLEL